MWEEAISHFQKTINFKYRLRGKIKMVFPLNAWNM